jgi:hypothetical protein
MYRLLENPASPQNSRHSTRASANEAVDRSREPVEGAMDITIAHKLLGGQ